MADAHNPIPSPQPGDSDDVELALETAQRMYKSGDLAEALKWLRRAANSAEEAGDDMRQLQLARLAADLTAVVNAGPQVVTSAPSIKPSFAPSAAPASATPASATPASAAPASASRLPQPPAKQPPPAPSARGSVAPSPSVPAKPSAASAASSGGPPPLPANKPKSVAPVAAAPARSDSQTPQPARASESQVPPAPKPAAVSIKPLSTAPVAAVKPAASSTPSVAPSKVENKPSPSTPSGFIDVGARGAVRVSVRVSARDENLMIVRPLAQGQRLPPGAREARLVFEDGATAFNQSHGE